MSTEASDAKEHDSPVGWLPTAVDAVVAIACVVALGHVTNRVVAIIALAWLVWLVILRGVEYLACIVLGR